MRTFEEALKQREQIHQYSPPEFEAFRSGWDVAMRALVDAGMVSDLEAEWSR